MRVGNDAVATWDASSEIADLSARHLPAQQARMRLERDALRLLAEVQPPTGSAVKTITVRIVYADISKSGPRIAASALKSTNIYGTITLTMGDAVSDRDHWKETLDTQAPPAWIHSDIRGKLPTG
jgi:hypothetical protein